MYNLTVPVVTLMALAPQKTNRLRQLVFEFDGVYDIHQAYDLIIPALRIDQFNTKDTANASLLVGSYWCHIVYYDVTHRLQGGMQMIEQSKVAASQLHEQLLEHNSTDEFSWYAVARWYDGAAKLMYRLGDHTQSRFWMALALQIVSPGGVLDSVCYYDIFSNQIRNRYEEKRQAGSRLASPEDEINQEIQDCIDKAICKLPDSLKAYAKGFGKLHEFIGFAQAACPMDRELLRGICSLYHNWSSLPTTARTERLSKSKHSEFIARALQDGYRLCQTLHQQACLQQDDNPELAIALWQQVITDGRWIRGALMSRQNILLQDHNLLRAGNSFRERRGLLVRAFDGLIDLADEIQQRSQIKQLEENSQVPPVLDIDLYGWTIQGAARRLEQLARFVTSDESLEDGRTIERLEARLMREVEQMLNSYRSVIKVATNKHAYATQFKWAYDRLISSAQSRNAIDEALYWVEESTSRDVLDMISTSIQPQLELEDLVFSTSISAAGYGLSPAKLPENDESNTVLSAASFVRANSENENLEIQNQIQSSIIAFEDHAEKNPVAASAISKDIHKQLLDFTCKTKAVVVRFIGVTQQNGKKLASALVSINGQLQQIDGVVLDDCLSALSKTLAQNVRGELRNAALLLAKQIGRDILDKLFVGKREEVMTSPLVCFVPTADTLHLPLHLGIIENQPLCYSTGTVYCGNLTALLTRGRLRGCWFENNEEKTLASIVSGHPGENGVRDFLGDESIAPKLSEKLNKTWFTGPDDFNLQSNADRVGVSSVTNIETMIAHNPTFMTIGAHGGYMAMEGTKLVHPYLKLGDDTILTPYHLATFNRMNKNRLVVLAACLAAQGSALEGGEVGGFYRALAALGAPAIALPFIPLIDIEARRFVRTLLTRLIDQNERVFLPTVITQVVRELAGDRSIESKVTYGGFGLFV
jgi:hypothetical protein